MKWYDLRAPQVREIAEAQDSIVIVPLGAIEQHGNHLPVKTDTLLAETLGGRVEAQCPGKVLLAPTLWLGASHHHVDFSGTLSVRVATYVAILRDLVECLDRQGFKKIIFLNGHGGNCSPIGQFLSERQEDGPREGWIVEATYWTMRPGESQTVCDMDTPRLSHACEYETSMVLSINPKNVELGLAEKNTPPFSSPYLKLHSEGASQVRASYRFSQVTASGAMGDARTATAEKGDKLLTYYTQSLVDFVNDFHAWPLLTKLS